MTLEWYEDDAMWERLFDFMFPPADFEHAEERQVPRLVELFGRSEGRVLDLPCGPGRHSVPLAKLGFDVTGVDRTPYLLGCARDLAADAGVEVEWVQADMREFVRPNAFDLALNAFTSLGYFREWDENARVVRNAFESLAPGGAFVVEILGKETLARIFTSDTLTDLEDGRIRIERRKVVDSWRRAQVEWIYLDGDRVTERYELEHWLYSAGELIDLFTAAGFVDVETYSGWIDRPYDHRSNRLLVIGRKP